MDGSPVPAADPDLPTALGRTDLAVLLQHHRAYDTDLIERHAPLLLDTRGSARPSPTSSASDTRGRRRAPPFPTLPRAHEAPASQE